MLTKLVSPGDRVDLSTIVRTANRNNADRKNYRSKVYDILSDEKLEILMPMEQSKLILLPVDGEYDLCFYTKQGLYQCYARVIDRYKSNQVYILLLEITSNLQKHQRRDYYRYACVMPMNGRELVKEENEAFDKGEPYLESGLPVREATIVDISGGGIRFVGRHRYEKDSNIYIDYKLMIQRKTKTYQLIGKVLTVKEIENRPGEYEHRLVYTWITNDAREEIIRYIFEEERKNRKKEKG